MDGVLVIDKPAGVTSHDVVAAARRALRERRIGHTGTLDPLATGVLPLACGRATRLVQFLMASDKDYDAEIRFGTSTDTYDITGAEVTRSERRPHADDIASALQSFTGEYLQAPPPYSAKKVGGRRAYELAREDIPVQPSPAPVRVDRLELLRLSGDVATVRITCSAGFYVRSLAHELGIRLGTGACLQALRRTRSGEFRIDDAIALDEVVRAPDAAAAKMVPMSGLLPQFPAFRLTDEGVRWVSHGRLIGPAQLSGPRTPAEGWARLLAPDGGLVALGQARGDEGSLHPSVVLI